MGQQIQDPHEVPPLLLPVLLLPVLLLPVLLLPLVEELDDSEGLSSTGFGSSMPTICAQAPKSKGNNSHPRGSFMLCSFIAFLVV